MLLYAGLATYAASIALVIRADLGAMPWDVFHSGVAGITGLSLGAVIALSALGVLLLWVPLRQRPGLGTVSNVIVLWFATDAFLAVIPRTTALPPRAALLVAGILANAVATAAYLSARFGPGPRDGLMTGLVRRTGRSVRLVKTAIEVTVVLAGIALGGAFGWGTLLYALAIGPLVQLALPLFGSAAPAPPDVAGQTEGRPEPVRSAVARGYRGSSGSPSAPSVEAASSART